MDRLAGERLLAFEKPVAALDDRDVGAERAICLRQLAADGAATEHEQLGRHLLRRRRLAIRPRLRFGEAVDRRQQRGAARGDHDRAARLQQLVADAHPALAVEPSVAAHERYALLLQPRQL